MRWVAKAALQRGLGVLPHGERLNYLFQRHVARSLPGGEPVVRRKLARARQHLEAFGRPAEDAVFYEFGAGWDLAIPLSYAALGVGPQVLVDIRPSARGELLNQTPALPARPVRDRPRSGIDRLHHEHRCLRAHPGGRPCADLPRVQAPLEARRHDQLPDRPAGPLRVLRSEPLAIPLPALLRPRVEPRQLAAALPEPAPGARLPAAVGRSRPGGRVMDAVGALG